MELRRSNDVDGDAEWSSDAPMAALDGSSDAPDSSPPVTELALANELLAACLGQLALHNLPRVARVNHRWQEAARVAFQSQLRWRGDARCDSLPLPVPAVPPARDLESQICHTGFSLAFLRGGELVVQMVDARLAAVRTFSFADGGSPQPHELARRGFADHAPFNAGVGGLVGYRHHATGGMSSEDLGMTFYPIVAEGRTAASEAVWVAHGGWQNVLHAGNIIFLLRAHNSWWHDARLTADLIDSDSGGRASVDVTPLRDALKGQLAGDAPARGAVSAANGHFIFHMQTKRRMTVQGPQASKVAASLRLPAAIPPPHRDSPCTGSAVDSEVAFARRWPYHHAITQVGMHPQSSEQPCGEYLMLWDDHAPDGPAVDEEDVLAEADDEPRVAAEGAGRRFAVQVVLLHARTGAATGRQLLAPPADGPHAPAGRAFLRGGIAAIDYNAASGVVAACSLPITGLPPPALLVWDWRSAACLHAVHLHPLPEPPPRAAAPPPGAPRPLRFAVGARVECRMGASAWAVGVVEDHYVSTGAPGQPPMPYLVRLDSGETCYAHLDHHGLIRSVNGESGREELAWNSRANAMEVAATACLVVHPSSTRIAIGMWHEHVAAGVLYSVDISSAGA